jgi:hypothetical protein
MFFKSFVIAFISLVGTAASVSAFAGDPTDHHLDGGTTQPDDGMGTGQNGGPSWDDNGHGDIDNPSFPGTGGSNDPDSHGDGSDIDNPSFPSGDDWGI